LQKEQHQKAAESDESSQSSARPKWDTHFNRALNILKKVPEDTPPSYGRVHGVGDGASWKTCYHEELEERRKRKLLTQQTIDQKVALAFNKSKAELDQTIDEKVDARVSAAVASGISSLLPAFFEWAKNNPDKGPADFPIPSYVGSNSVNIAPLAPAHATAHAPAPVHSSPSSVSGQLGGPSSMAELDALTVITRHTLFTSMSI
jgi:hypothetical protein